jgi:precorrin-3B C17-methyltransferase
MLTAMSEGKIYVVGTGPGDKKDMTLRAVQAIEEGQVIIGYALYTDLLGEMLQGKEIISSGMRGEVERCYLAVEEAARGKKVVLVSSGDAGIYGMAGVVLQVMAEKGITLEVEIVPGVTAASAAAAILGAPLMHDFAVISLSDLLTPWELIETRLQMAGKGDFVVVLYNPRSHGRKEQLQRAQQVLLKYREGRTPVGIVRNAGREGEVKRITVLERMLECEIDMATTVIIGNSRSYIWQDKIITPRGYEL